ncbi:MAG TPA: lactate utilization protein C [Sulfuriferula sp.]|nr:lactate utilization protein C [Sulfuriferula sp.]
MSARERILARIGKSLSGSTPAEIDAYLAAHPRGPAPTQLDNLVAHFKERAMQLSSDIIEIADRTTIPAHLARYLAERSLPPRGVCWPAFASLPWGAANLEIAARPANSQDLVGITGAFCAIAETGTLMTLSGPETPPSNSLLPETHIAIMETRRIIGSMEDAWDLLRDEYTVPPRAVNFISGPSRTADIEQTVTLGAHGPYRVLVFLVSG